MAGMLFALALMLFLTSSVRNFFVASGWEDPSSAVPGVWILMTSAWILSVFAGSVLASLGARAQEIADGVLQGVTVWAVSYLAFGTLIAVKVVGYEPIVELDDVSGMLVLKDFAGEFFALIAGAVAGALASKRGRTWVSQAAKSGAVLAST